MSLQIAQSVQTAWTAVCLLYEIYAEAVTDKIRVFASYLWEVSACTPTDTLEKLCAMLLAGVVSDEAPLDEAREELERCCARLRASLSLLWKKLGDHRASARFCLCLKDSEVLLKRPVVGSLQSLDTSKRSCRTS